MDFDTKIAIVVRDDLAVWQKLNVTAFITSGIIGQEGALLGDEYEDVEGVSQIEDLKDPELARRMGQAMDERMSWGEVRATPLHRLCGCQPSPLP